MAYQNGANSKPNPAAQHQTQQQPAAAKREGKSFNLKVKVGDKKWKTLGTLFMREDGTGGVATLYADVQHMFQEGMQRLEKIAIFVNDRPAKAA